MSFYDFLNTSNFTFPRFNFGSWTVPNFSWNNGIDLKSAYTWKLKCLYPITNTFIPFSNNNYQINLTNNSYQKPSTQIFDKNYKDPLFDNFSNNNFDFFDKKPRSENAILKYSSIADRYATNNELYIKNLTGEMQERTKKLIAFANKNGYDVKISSGYRSPEKQKELQERYKDSPGRVAKKSAHCAGKAIDIKVTKDGNESDAGYSLLGEYAKSELGMRWGGDFTSYRERWHFDYDWA